MKQGIVDNDTLFPVTVIEQSDAMPLFNLQSGFLACWNWVCFDRPRHML